MLILHAGIAENALLLWGETPDIEAAVGLRGRVAPGQTSPYDAGAERLREALRQVGQPDPSKRQVASAAVWLPTAGGRPAASSPLIAPPPPPRSRMALSPWWVTALRFPLAPAVDLLCAVSGKELVAPGISVGRDLAFWSTALQFAGSLAGRQQFLPSIAERDGGFRACWEPVFAGIDAQRLSQLADAMPHACRAFGIVESPPQATPRDATCEFVGIVLDHLVRSSLLPARPVRLGRRRGAFDSIHDQWLHALQSPDGSMPGDGQMLAEFAVQVREWQRPMAATAASPFRLCLRLEEPDQPHGAENAWRVHYLLQACDDLSLLVPAEDAWKATGRRAAVLKRGGFHAREHLLTSLGQAAGICSRIEASLRAATPTGYEMDSAGAYEFLTDRAPALEQAGFGVMLPAWWTRRGTRARLSARAKAKSPGLRSAGRLSLDDIVHFDWEVALGGHRISLEELQELARLKSPLVQLRGQWVEVNAEEIRAAVDLWQKRQEGAATAREVVQMALGQGAAGPLPLDGVTATGWVGDLLAGLEGAAELQQVAPPVGFQGRLRPYQERGYSWLCFLRRWGLGACLADDMGLGKTIQALALIQREWEADGKRPTLLVCPTSVVRNWEKEAQRFAPQLPVMIHHGAARTRGDQFMKRAERHAMVISSYALLHRDYETLKSIDWAAVILDEAQNVKNPETKQSRAARGLPAECRIALTGTPVENSVGDLWAIMEFLNPGFLGSQAEFRRRFLVPIQAYRDAEASARLKRLTQPFILRRLKTDETIISDLPEKLEMKVFCSLTREQASLYAAVAKEATEALDSLAGIERKGMVLATLTRLKQICNHPAQFLADNSALPNRSGKLARLTEMLEEVMTVGDRALIFSQFAEMGGMLRTHLQEMLGREVLFLHGGVPRKQRDHMVERFQEEAEGPHLFVLSLKAGGTGLNLTRANHVFHYDRWWNPAVENQATDRAFRIGQTRNVQVHKLLCAGTLEERIDEMIVQKQEIAAEVVGSGEGWLTRLSTAELKDLFALRKDAVAE